MSIPSASEFLANSHWIVGGALALLALSFFIWFLVPGWRAAAALAKASKVLVQQRRQSEVSDVDAIEKHAMTTPALRHAWREFRDTLHAQKRLNAQGEMKVVRWRATTLAGTFFTDRVLVEGPLHTEFFRHLPGILTGLGIIGTFAGVILGLQDFKVVDDPDVVRNSLTVLMSSVGQAFVVSALAIFLAMLVTLVEKLRLNSLYASVETLCGLIDSLFDSGAGEEYLQRLVEASETSATQAQHIKDALVADLKQVLTELTQQQIASIASSGQQTAAQITQSIAEGLSEPLTRISKAVENVGSDQGQAVNRLVTDVLSSFSAQMEGMFGSQLSGMNTVLQETAQAIQAASQRFDSLSERIQSAGTGAVESMGKRMEEMLESMQARQSESNAQMAAFVEQLKATVSQSQSEGSAQLRAMLTSLAETADHLVKRLEAQSHTAQEEHAKRQAALAHHTGDLMSRQGSHVQQLATAVQDATSQMRSAVERLTTATSNTVDGMKVGASSLQGAAERLATNLNKMREASDGLGETAQRLMGSGQTLSSATNAAVQALADQKAVRDALSGMVSDLRGVVENAKRDAGMTTSLVNGLQLAATRLSEAQKAADTYLQGVTAVLGEAHATFAREIEKTLRTGNAEFHKQLEKAVGHLSGAIAELGQTVDGIPERA